MKVKALMIMTLMLGMGLFTQDVSAKEIYYTNDLGVVLDFQEYNFISNMYWEGYQEYITPEDYDEIKEMDLFDKEIEKEVINFPITRGASVTSNLRTLSIAKSCSSTCMISLVNKWNGTPTVKSYDVIGARVNKVTISSVKNALVSGENYAKTYSNPQLFSNGFGYSILVPNVSNVKTSVTFVTSKGGTIYGSYQHAMSNTTEAISKSYTIGVGGYGRVFNFEGTARSVYEDAPGVDLSV